MKDEQNNDEHAFGTKDAEAFLKRLGIPVTPDTIRLVIAIDFHMRRGNRGAAQEAAEELMAAFLDGQTTPEEFDGRVEHNDNALDRDENIDSLVTKALKFYENMQITLQAADPEESSGEMYSDNLTDWMTEDAGLPNDPLIKPWLKRIGTVFATEGAEAAEREAGGLIGHLVADGHIEGDAARANMLRQIMRTIQRTETMVDAYGDPDGNEDLYSDSAPTNDGDVEIDLSLKEEDDRRRAEEAQRAEEEQRRVDEEYGRRERALFQDIAYREGGLISQLPLDPDVEEDKELALQLMVQMREYELLQGGPTPGGIDAVTNVMNEIEKLAAELAKRLSRTETEAAEITEELRGEIVNEAREVTRQHEPQAARIYQDVQAEIRQEAEGAAETDETAAAPAQDAPDTTQGDVDAAETPNQPDPAPTETAADDNPDPSKSTDLDVQKVAVAMRENGMKEAKNVAMRIAGLAHDEGTLPVSEADMVEDLLARAQAFIIADDEYQRKDLAAYEKALKAKQDAKAAETTPPETEEPEAQPNTDAPAPSLSDYREELLSISFLLASEEPDEARAEAAKLAETLRAFGGQFAKIDAAMILKHVVKEDKKAKDARIAAAAAQGETGSDTDSEDEDSSDPAGWFLLTALRKDARSVELFNGLVTAVMRGDKGAAGKLAKALANHILQLYKTNVKIPDMLAAIVNAAKQEAKAKQDAKDKMDGISEISSFSVDNSDSDSSDGDGPGGSGDGGDTDDDDDLSDRASWFLMTAVEKDAKSAELYDALVRVLLKGDKSAGAKLAKALAKHILQMYKTTITLPEMLEAIVNAAREDVKANKDDASETSTDSGYDGDNEDNDDFGNNDDNDDGAGAAAVAADTNDGVSYSQIKFDLGTVKKVDWGSLLSIYSMDAEESEAAADVAKLIVRKGKDAPGVLKSAKDLLTRSSKKVKGAKVKNHKHFVAALEDALIKKTESKKVVKPLKFADIPDDISDDISV